MRERMVNGWRRSWIIGALLGAVACAPAVSTRPLSATSAAVTGSLDEPIDRAFESPRVDAAMSKLIEDAMASPELAADGERLLSALGQSPALQRAQEEIQSQLVSLPSMQALVGRIMQENPGAAPERIGELTGARVEKILDAPSVDRAIEAAIDRLFERPALNAAFDRLGERAAQNPTLARSLAQALSKDDEQKLEARLKELNGGVTPSEAQVEPLLAKHAFTNERVEALVLAWLALPETRAMLVELAHELLVAPTFQAHVERLAARVVAQAETQRAVLAALDAVLSDHENAAGVESAVARVFDTPLLEKELAAFTDSVIEDLALGALAEREVAQLFDSPGFRSTFRDFALGW